MAKCSIASSNISPTCSNCGNLCAIKTDIKYKRKTSALPMLSAIKSLVSRTHYKPTKVKQKHTMASAQSSQGALELTRLTELITSSVQDVLSEYQNAGQHVPWLSSTEPGPFDKPHLASPKLSKAIQIIEAACAQLSFAVASPGHVITNVRSRSI